MGRGNYDFYWTGVRQTQYNPKATLHKIKDKGIAHEVPEEESRCSSTFSLTSALDGCGWSRPRPGLFTTGNNPVTIELRLGGPQNESEQVRKTSPPTGIRSPDPSSP